MPAGVGGGRGAKGPLGLRVGAGRRAGVAGLSQGGWLSPGLHGRYRKPPPSPGPSVKCTECVTEGQGVKVPQASQPGCSQERARLESVPRDEGSPCLESPRRSVRPSDFTGWRGGGAPVPGGTAPPEAGRKQRSLAGAPGLGLGGGVAPGRGRPTTPVTSPRAAAAGPRPLPSCPRTRQASRPDAARHWA